MLFSFFRTWWRPAKKEIKIEYLTFIFETGLNSPSVAPSLVNYLLLVVIICQYYIYSLLNYWLSSVSFPQNRAVAEIFFEDSMSERFTSFINVPTFILWPFFLTQKKPTRQQENMMSVLCFTPHHVSNSM